MDTDANMTFSRLDEVLISREPGILLSWMDREELHASVLFSTFKTFEKTGTEESKSSGQLQHLLTNEKGLIGSTAMHVAVEAHSEFPFMLDEILELVSRMRAEPRNSYRPQLPKCSWEVEDDFGFTPVALAVSMNDSKALEKLCVLQPDLSAICSVQRPETFSSTILGLSIFFGATDSFEYLLKLGVDASVWDKCGKRAVHIAAEYGSIQTLQTLLKVDRVLSSTNSKDCMDLYTVRQDFISIGTEDGKRRKNNRVLESSDSTAEDLFEDLQEDTESGNELNDDDRPPPRNISERSFEPENRGDSEDEEEGGFLTPAEVLVLEREMEDAGFQIRRDRSGNITAHFTGVTEEDPIPQEREDIDIGGNLLHLACKGKRRDVVQFLLTTGRRLQSVNERRFDGMSALHIAAKSNQNEIVRMLVEVGSADINIRNDYFGMCPIHTACENDARDALSYLLACGVSPDFPDDNLFTPLHYAASKEDSTDCIETLVRGGADVNAQANNGETPLYTAISKWNLKNFWTLLRLGANPGMKHSDGTVVLGFIAANSMEELSKFADFLCDTSEARRAINLDVVVGDGGQTCLHIAAKKRSMKAVHSLTMAGANPNAQDDEGSTPLSVIMSQKAKYLDEITGAVAALLRKGANPNIPDQDGFTPLLHACRNGHGYLATVLLQKGADPNAKKDSMTPLHFSVISKDETSLRGIISYGAHLDARDANGLTPLHWCAKRHFLEGLRHLLNEGADVLATTSNESTCLHLCAEVSDYKLGLEVELLVQSGAELNALNAAGDLPIHVHIRKKRTDGVRALISAGCHLNILSNSGQTPLMTACEMGYRDAVRMLLQSGANVSVENESKHTALFYFAETETETIRILRLLIAAGANIMHKDKDGDTVLHEAVLGNHATIVRFLMRIGMDLNVRNNDLETVLFQASKHGFEETVRVLLNNSAPNKADPKLVNIERVSPYQAARLGGHWKVMQVILNAMGVRLSDFAPLIPSTGSPVRESGIFGNREEGLTAGRTFCAICQDDLFVGQMVRNLPCNHQFHDQCILPWIGGETMCNNRICPVCKQQIAPSEL